MQRFKVNPFQDYHSIHEQSFLNAAQLQKRAKLNQSIRYNTRQKKNKIKPTQYGN